METIVPRKISSVEVTLLNEALVVAPVVSMEESIMAGIPQLQIVCRCACGCASVGFVSEEETKLLPIRRLADAEGVTEKGEPVGFLVWGTPSRITGIEVYWSLEDGAPLPVVGSLRSFKATG